MQMGLFRTRRTVVRPFRISDFNVWHKAYAEGGPAKNRWDHGPLPAKLTTRIEFRKFIKRLRDLAREDDYYRYGVFARSTGALLGHIDFDVYVRLSLQFANFGT